MSQSVEKKQDKTFYWVGKVIYYKDLESPESHYYIILNEPSFDNTNIIMVNLTDFNSISDKSCVIDIGEEHFITKKSKINYEKVLILQENTINNLIKTNTMKTIDNPIYVSRKILERVLLGARITEYFPFENEEFILKSVENSLNLLNNYPY